MKLRIPLKTFCAACSIFLSIGGVNAEELEGSIMTVRGPIPAAALGKTLSHEHVLVDFVGAEESGYHRWDREEVISVMLPRLREIRDLGYRSLFECTPAFLGRDPRLLRRLSELSDLNLITNTGYYGARENQFIPESIQDWPVQDLVDKWIQEFEMGIEDTGIRPGFLKIGVDREVKLSEMN